MVAKTSCLLLIKINEQKNELIFKKGTQKNATNNFNLSFILEKALFDETVFFEGMYYLLVYEKKQNENKLFNIVLFDIPDFKTIIKKLPFLKREKATNLSLTKKYWNEYFFNYFFNEKKIQEYLEVHFEIEKNLHSNIDKIKKILNDIVNLIALKKINELKLWKIYDYFFKLFNFQKIKIFKTFLSDKIYHLIDNSYEQNTINFKMVDNFYLKILMQNADNNIRHKAIINSIFFEFEKTKNDTWHDEQNLKKILNKRFPKSYLKIIKLLDEMIAEKQILERDLQKRHYLIWAETYKKEKEVYDILKSFFIRKNKIIGVKTLLTSKELASFSEEQITAIRRCTYNSINIISGGPGTGKTTIVKKIYDTLSETYNQDQIIVLAPTGMAVNRLKNYGVYTAGTFHLTFKELFYYKTTKNNKTIKALVVDEFSMVNLHLLHSVLKHCIALEKIVLIGDINQLPSIGAGNLFNDINLLFHKDYEANFTFLKKNYRYKNHSAIDRTISYFLKGYSQEKLRNLIRTTKDNFFLVLFDLYFNFLKDVPVINKNIITPYLKGDFGTTNINRKIQEKIFGKDCPFFNKNDKIMRISNDYKSELFNGQIATIKKMPDFKKDSNYEILLDNGDLKNIEKKNFSREFILAYASTVHKFQGSQSQVIIFVYLKEHRFMHSENLIYTALTRAQEKIYIIGDVDDFQKRVGDFVKKTFRTSMLNFKNN